MLSVCVYIIYPEGHFNILSSPDLHLLIIAPNVIEIISRDREQSSSKCWCSIQLGKKHLFQALVKHKSADLYVNLSSSDTMFYLCTVLLDGIGLIFAPLFFMIRQTLPAKGQGPVKVAPIVVLPVRRRLHELKRVQVDSCNVWTHHCSVVLCYSG